MFERANLSFCLGIVFSLASCILISLFFVNANTGIVATSIVLVVLACAAFYISGATYEYEKRLEFTSFDDLKSDCYKVIYEYEYRNSVALVLIDVFDEDEPARKIYSVRIPGIEKKDFKNYLEGYGFRWEITLFDGVIVRIVR